MAILVDGKLIFEAKISKKRLLAIPKAAAEILGLEEGSRVKIIVEGERLIIEPVRDAIWYAIHGPKIGYVGFEDLEKESVYEQERFKDTT